MLFLSPLSLQVTTFALAVSSVSSATVPIGWYKPTAGTSFLYTIDGGTVPPSPRSASGLPLNATLYDVDLFDTTSAVIAGYKQQGKKVICYFSAGSFETNRADIASFTPSCYCNKASSCKMDGWNEWWLNIHSTQCKSNIQRVMKARIELAKSKGCDGVDPDNVDSYLPDNNNGHGNTADDQLSFNLFLARTAHAAGLAVGLKNAGDLLAKHTSQIVTAFDFAVVEQCEQYNECDTYSPFTKSNKAAFDIEYGKQPVYKMGWFTMLYKSQNLIYTQVTKTAPAY